VRRSSMAVYASVTSQFEIEDVAWARCAIAARPDVGGSCQPPVGLLTRRVEVVPRCVGCSKLCGVAEPSSWGVSARHPDRLIKWFIGVVVLGVGVNLLSGLVVAQKSAWLPPVAFVGLLLVAVPSTGLLRRERYRTTRARGMALLALAGYLAVVAWGSVTGWPLAVMILSVAFLWEAGVMLMWSTLRSRADLDRVALWQPVCFGS
jgi:hypothetical protein